MLSGKFHGRDLGSGTGLWQMSEQVRAGDDASRRVLEAESCMHRSKGHCMTMGTASTMASMVEALGMSLPGNAAIPAVDARRSTLAQMTGRRIVEMVREDLRISQHPDAASIRKCHSRQRSHRRIHQRRDSSDRDRRTHRRATCPRRFRSTGFDLALPGQHSALRKISHGRFLLCGRPAGVLRELDEAGALAS